MRALAAPRAAAALLRLLHVIRMQHRSIAVGMLSLALSVPLTSIGTVIIYNGARVMGYLGCARAQAVAA